MKFEQQLIVSGNSKKMTNMAAAGSEQSYLGAPNLVETAGETFADGSQIDLLAPISGKSLRLALWDGGKETNSPSILYKGKTYVPMRLQPGLVRDVTLPSGCQSHESTREFLWDICSLIKKFSGLENKAASILGRIALLSAIVDAVPMALTLLIVGPDVDRGKQLMALLGCLCRHAVRLSGLTRPAFTSLPSGLQLSYLISQPGFSKGLKTILATAACRDEKILVRGDLVDLFGIAILHDASGLVTGDFSPLRPIEISMAPTGKDLPVLDSDTQRRITDEYQAKLLSFRRANLSLARQLKFDASALSFPLRPVARALAAATPDEPQLQAEIVDLLRDEEQSICEDRFINLDCVAVEALLVAAHKSASGAIYVSDLAAIAQQILYGRGEQTAITPGLFGKRLKALGFSTLRDARGSKLLLGDSVTHAKELARNLKIVGHEVILQKRPNL